VLKAKELSQHPVITMTEGSGLTRAFDAWAAEQVLRMERIVASNSLMAIIGLTMADVGLSFLPEEFMRPWIDRGSLIALRSVPPLPTLRYCFLHRDDDRRAMLPILLQCVAEVAQFSTPAGLSRKTT
jgi:DNA-binding transcriptional LysR family regulator